MCGILTMQAWPLMRFGYLRPVVCVYAVNRVQYAQTVKGSIKHLHETTVVVRYQLETKDT